MKPDIFPIFFVVWAVLAVVGLFLFYVNKNAQFKRKYFPWYIILTGVLFCSFILVMGFPVLVMFIVVPVIAIISYLNIKSIKFCDNCGKTLVNQAWLIKPENCAKCGAKLND